MVGRLLGLALKTLGLHPLSVGRIPPATQRVVRTVVRLHPPPLPRLLRFPRGPLLPDWGYRITEMKRPS
jgi:hypothetical protein